jgi:hypothetical protein
MVFFGGHTMYSSRRVARLSPDRCLFKGLFPAHSQYVVYT